MPAEPAEPQPDDVSLHVGKRIRIRRLLLGLSQAELAKSLQVTQQQLLNYERGTSRVNVSRLYACSRALGVPMEFFFEDFEPPSATGAGTPSDVQSPRDDGGIPLGADGRADRDTLAVVRAFKRISDPERRRAMLDLLKRFGPEEK